MSPASKQDIVHQLQRDILRLQGSRPSASGKIDLGLGPVLEAFPGNSFPTGAIHELISHRPENAAATSGFTAGLISGLMRSGGACVWVSCTRRIYPPGLKAFGIEPDHIVFMDMRNEKEVLWATEEALKCDGLSAVVGEIRELSMIASRRYQLAVEQSRVTGLIVRNQPRNVLPTAAVARWQVTHLPSIVEDGMPGPGAPRWNIELTRIRNGVPGSWQTEWRAGRFCFETPPAQVFLEGLQRKTG
ncbi:MAG: Error-prone repair protein ImuA [Bacteroidetes bacterium]|nr:Error-prone repair protein ImuA [Bacteroidota bacterium]